MKKKKQRKRSRRSSKGPRREPSASQPPNEPEFSIPLEEALQSPEKLQTLREELLQWIRTQAKELETILLQYNSFNMLANLMVTQLWSDPEKYKETTHTGLAAFVEYAALLYLKHPFNVGGASFIDGPVLEQIESKMRRIFVNLNFYWAAESLPEIEGKERPALDAFRYRTISNELVVRSPGYAHHQEERLRVLFEPIKDELFELLGFTVDDVLAIEKAREEVMQRKLAGRMDAVRKGEQELLEDLRAARAGSSEPRANEAYIQSIKALPSKQAKRHIKHWITLWGATFLGTQVYSFCAGEIASEAGLPVERVEAMLNYFSLDFGSVPADFYIPSPTHEVRVRPFLHNDGVYMCPLPGSLIWAVQPRLEESINPNSPNTLVRGDRIWKRYEKNRKNYLEQETLRLLGSTLKHVEVYGGLQYQIIEDGVAKKTELDGLIIYDTTFFLIEAKAGSFSFSARRGSKDRIKRDLKELLGRAHSQAVRAKRYIEETDSPTFVTSEGKKVVVDKGRFWRTFMVTVTLEPMDTFNAMLHEVARAGVLEEAELPWAVSLDILRVICEMNEFPTQLVHYLQRRLRVNEFRKFRTSDELDWFGLYLARGLYFDNDERFREADFVHFGSFSTPFDDYYLYETGMRKRPVAKPTQPMPKILRDIILELDARGGSYGHSEAVLRLLSLNDEGRRNFASFFRRIRRMTLQDRRQHDFTLGSSEARAGITCFSAVSRDAEEVFEQLEGYVRVKKYQTGADHWLGLLTVVDYPGMIHGFIAGNEPWAPDENLEAISAELIANTADYEGD